MVDHIKEPGPFRKLLSEMGGRSWLLVTLFVSLMMLSATALLFRTEFTPEHWLSAGKICLGAIGAIVGKRAVEEIGSAFGKRDCDQ